MVNVDKRTEPHTCSCAQFFAQNLVTNIILCRTLLACVGLVKIQHNSIVDDIIVHKSLRGYCNIAARIMTLLN